MPMMHGVDITSLISDSGITRYRMQAKVWDIFQNDSSSYWYFPEGLYVEQFDTLFNVQGFLKADTGYYYETKSLWHVIGNVYIQNLDGLTFETSELFWNEKEPANSINAIYTDKYVEVNTIDGRTITGIGMRSNQSMSHYTFYSSGGGFQVEENTPDKEEDKSIQSAERDSIEVNQNE